MKALRKSIFLFLIVSFLAGVVTSNAWTQEKRISNDEMNLLDLFIARPLGIVGAAVGTCVFIASLPFTLSTRSVGDSFNLFVVEPWKFSFVRDFPDESAD